MNKNTNTATKSELGRKPCRARGILVGCGRAGTQLHYGAFLKNGASFVAVCDTNAELARLTAQRFGVPYYYATLEEALQKHQVDFVDISTPPHTHCDLAILAMRNGCHVFMEKPMTVTIEEADRLNAVRLETGSKIVIGHNYRFMPGIKQALDLYRRGTIGQLLHLNHYMMYVGNLTRMIGPGHWQHDLPGGLLLEGNPHCLYIAYSFAGDLQLECVHVRKLSEEWPHIRADDIDVLLKTSSAYVNIRLTLNMVKPVPHKGGFVGGMAVGTEGVLIYEPQQCVHFQEAFARPPVFNMNRLRSKIRTAISRFQPERKPTTEAEEPLNIGVSTGHYELIGKFLDYITTGGEAPVPWDEAYETVRLNHEIGNAVEIAVKSNSTL